MTESSGRIICHVDADAFFASVEQLTNPRLRGKPVVVCGLPFGHGVVTAASYEARPYGIKAGMPTVQAKRLLPQGIFLPVNIPKYLYFSTKLLSIYLQMTPLVEAYSVDEVFLDLTGVLDLRATAQELKRKISEQTGLSVSVGIGPNKLIAKIASDLHKPDGLTIVSPLQAAEVLGVLPIERCPGVGAKTVAFLKTLGILTFSDLSAVPLEKLRWWFGKNGEKLYWAAKGIDHSPVIPLAQLPPLQSKGHEITFDRPLCTPEHIKAVIWKLSEKVGFELRSKKLVAKGVRLRLKPISAKAISRQARLGTATTDERIIAAAGYHLFCLQNITELRGLGISGINLVQRDETQSQLELFDLERAGYKCLQTTVDQLKLKYGEEVVVPALNLLCQRPVFGMDR